LIWIKTPAGLVEGVNLGGLAILYGLPFGMSGFFPEIRTFGGMMRISIQIHE